MIIFGFNIESPRSMRARKLYHAELIQHLEDKAAKDVFEKYLNGVKDGMRMARSADQLYAQVAQEYNPKNIH